MFDKEVICDARIVVKLNFQSDIVLNEIRLVLGS